MFRILTVCPTSIDAIQGSIGAVCQAVDSVIVSTRTGAATTPPQPQRAFVAVRPPGHHCGEDTPSGFCFVNNVAIGAAHGLLRLPSSWNFIHPFRSSPHAWDSTSRHTGY